MKLSLEQIREHPAFLDLMPRQRTLVEEYLTHGDKKKATHTAYTSKTASQIVFSKTPVRRVLAIAAGEKFAEPVEKSALDTFRRDVQLLMKNPKTTPSQIAAARLYATLNGFADSVADESPKGKIVADQVIERDGRKLRTVVTDVTDISVEKQ